MRASAAPRVPTKEARARYPWLSAGRIPAQDFHVLSPGRTGPVSPWTERNPTAPTLRVGSLLRLPAHRGQAHP